MSAFDVLVDLVHTFDDNLAILSVHGHHGPACSRIVSRNDFNRVTLTNVHLNNSENTLLI